MYKFDTHVHCLEGSYDAEVRILETVRKLKKLGFSGMIITDHDTYNGWRKYKQLRAQVKDFVVIKGIEVTAREGHFIAIPPNEVTDCLENCRNESIYDLVKLAIRSGHVIGPSHPYCQRYGMGNYNFPMNSEEMELMKSFNFVEGFNPGTTYSSNRLASELAEELNLPSFSGSDSHVIHNVGICGTVFTELPKNNEEFCEMILKGTSVVSSRVEVYEK